MFAKFLFFNLLFYLLLLFFLFHYFFHIYKKKPKVIYVFLGHLVQQNTTFDLYCNVLEDFVEYCKTTITS